MQCMHLYIFGNHIDAFVHSNNVEEEWILTCLYGDPRNKVGVTLGISSKHLLRTKYNLDYVWVKLIKSLHPPRRLEQSLKLEHINLF